MILAYISGMNEKNRIRLLKQLDQLIESPLQNADAEKLRKRFLAHRDENFTFLRYKHVEPDNNRAERALRPSVVMRKITYGNNSKTGAFNHETLMSLVETAKLNNANQLDLMMSLAGGMDITNIKKMLFSLRIQAENNPESQDYATIITLPSSQTTDSSLRMAKGLLAA